MPVDFRYHLASLIAVFGALLIGILLGVAMNEGPGIRHQISGLREEFRRSEALRDVDKRANQFNERTENSLVRNRMTGRNVALIINSLPIQPDVVDNVQRTLQKSGAVITVEVMLNPGLMQITSPQIEALYQQCGIETPSPPDLNDMLRRIGNDLGRGWSRLVPALLAQKMITIHGDITTPISTVIFIGGPNRNSTVNVTKLDVPFLRGCLDRGFNIAVTEPLEAQKSAIAIYRKLVPITIDNIDRAAGRIALVLALSSNQRGNYGYKSTADATVPVVE